GRRGRASPRARASRRANPRPRAAARRNRSPRASNTRVLASPGREPGVRGTQMAKERRDRGDGDSRDNALVDYVVKIRRSACVVKGGRRFSFNALVVVGDKRGKVSYGYGKANEEPPAVEKAIKEGEGNVNRTRKNSLRGNTIPHRIIGKYGASRVIM